MKIQKKYDDNGNVAVLYSPGYGAGWSTWCSEAKEEFMMFDSGLVDLAIKKADVETVMRYLAKQGVNEYCGGWKHINIEWVPINTLFKIDEYDGYESIKYASEHSWSCA